jgi:solute carrier family 25 iron transporter 28/37
MSEQQAHKESVTLHLFGGALAGVIADGIVHPVDTIRARLQTQKNISYTSATDALFKIYRTEGIKALYRGFGAVLVGTIPGHALYFAAYEYSKKVLNKITNSPADNNPTVHLVAGLLADAAGAATWTPMDVVKQKLQVYNRSTSGEVRYHNSWQTAATIIKEDGFKGLYKGYWTSLATYGPYVALYFAGYERLKHIAREYYGKYDLPFVMYLGMAGIAGSISAAVTCPLDVIKTRLQVQDKTHTYEYKNGFDALKKIIKNEGIPTLFRGIKPRSLWMAGGTAITMAAYEEIKKIFAMIKGDDSS